MPPGNKMPACKLCDKEKNLMSYHAIPNAIFRKLFHEFSGKSIAFRMDDDSPVGFSSESWAEYQLCSDCEGLINSNYEQYAISLIRGSEKNVYKSDYGVSFKNAKNDKFILFLVSILWRAAESSNPAYLNIVLPDNIKNYIKNCILYSADVPKNLLSIEISRLKDFTVENGFSDKDLKGIIVSPFCRVRRNQASFCFLLEGFFVEIFFPAHQFKCREKANVIKFDGNFINAPYVDIFSIPELLDAMKCGYEKYHQGNFRNDLDVNLAERKYKST